MDGIQPNRQATQTKNHTSSPSSPSTQSVAKFNEAFNNHQTSGSFPVINGQQAADDALIQNPNTQESYWVPKGAAPDAARAATLGSDISGPSTKAVNAGREVSGSLFVGVAGVAVSAGGNADSSATACVSGTSCLQLGIGGFLGGSTNTTAGVGAPLTSGTTDTWGAFVSAGDGASLNGSINVDTSHNVSGVKGGVGPGIGAAAGIQFCRVDAKCTAP
jgi:hypothetical protein